MNLNLNIHLNVFRLCLSNANNLSSCVALPNLGLETLRILMAVLPAMDATDLEAQAIMCCPNRYMVHGY
jgi:hypothetical protein